MEYSSTQYVGTAREKYAATLSLYKVMHLNICYACSHMVL